MRRIGRLGTALCSKSGRFNFIACRSWELARLTRWGGAIATVALVGLVASGGGSTVRAEDVHVVRAGDTLSDIAQRLDISVSELARRNNLTDPNLITAGAILQLSAKSTAPTGGGMRYRVVAGDTLTEIAARFAVSQRDLENANSITNPDLLRIGDLLVIPAGRGTGSTSVSDISKAEAASILRRVADEYGIDRSLFLAMSYQESGWQQNVVSSRGAVGITQVLPDTAIWAVDFLEVNGSGWRYSALDNARVGAAVLRHLLKLSGGDTNVALAAYYQGWRSVQTNGMYSETRQYVRNVNALRERFR